MSHALVTVIVPRDGSTTLEEMMEPYNENTAVEPYHEEYDLSWARETFGLPEDASPGDYVKAAIERWGDDGEKFHVCDGRVCTVTTYNPRSKWDYWRPLELQQKDWDAKRHTESASKEPGTFATFSLLLPDEGWIDRGHLGWFGFTSGEMDREKWERLFLAAVEARVSTGQYDVVVCDYHI